MSTIISQTELTAAQREAILELGSRGAGGSFDQSAMSELFALGMIEVRNDDRRVALTQRGRAIYKRLTRLL
jgi:hypothetical protein